MQEVFMRYLFELLLVCLSLTALASCAREDDESSNQILAEAATPAATPIQQSPSTYDAEQARLDWLARPDTPDDSFGYAGGE
jgi:hypothetical protein